jgi:hypothetical protein
MSATHGKAGYFPQGLSEYGGLRHIILAYSSKPKDWSPEDFRFSVTHLNQGGEPDDWFFDSFLFMASAPPSGNAFYPGVNLGTTRSSEGDYFNVPTSNPARKDDWAWLLDNYFGEDTMLGGLDRYVEEAEAKLGPSGRKVNVVITIPYPCHNQACFGRIAEEGKRLNFSILKQDLVAATQQRLDAVEWFVEQALDKVCARNYRHVNFLGFYWYYETLHRSFDVDDHWLLKKLSKFVRAKGTKLFWVPFFSTYNIHQLGNYQKYYFDCAFLQPNHLQYKALRNSVAEAAEAARENYAGIEMEFDKSIEDAMYRSRFRDYLNGGVEFGFMKEAACAWYDGGKGPQWLYEHPDPELRGLYEDIYRFVKGTYRKK